MWMINIVDPDQLASDEASWFGSTPFSNKSLTRNVSQGDKCTQKQDISTTEARGQGHSDPKTVCDTQQPQDIFTH